MPRFLAPALALILLIAAAPVADAAGPKRGVNAKVSKKTLTITGDKKANKIVVRVKKRATKTLEIDTGGSSKAEFGFKRSRFTKIVVRAGAGNDAVSIDERGGVFTTSERTTVNGDAGNDRLTGGRGIESFDGGAGNDTADPNGGNDSVMLGAGDDTFRSDPNDGNDKVDGQAGSDRLLVVGGTGADSIAAGKSAARVRVLRGTAVAVDSAAFEALDLAPLAGADTLTVSDLKGTSLGRVGLDLARTVGGASGDGAADKLVVNGGAAADDIAVTGNGANVGISGIGPAIAATRVEPGADTLAVNGVEGADKINSGALGATALKLTVDGGPGDDEIAGGPGAEALAGGDGNDGVSGGAGNDSAGLGGGDDSYAWKAGDGTDAVDGGAGNDRVSAAATGDPDELSVSDDATRLRIARGGEAVLGDGVETAEVAPGGGADRLTVADLRGTDTGQTNVNFGDDGQPDEVAVSGGGGDDSFALNSDGGATLTGSIGRTTITGGDAGADKLAISTGAGNDTIDASALAGGRVALTIDSGEGADSVTGSGGGDNVSTGPGDDTYSAVPGASDAVEAGDGNDRLLFRGSDGADEVTAAGNGTRIQLLSAGVPFVDAGGFETLDFQPLGGADSVVIEPSVTSAGITTTNADFAADGGGDSATDIATVSGTDASDTIGVSSDASGAHVAGVPVRLNVTGSEAADRIGINALGGTDTVDGSTVAAGVIGLTINGGDLADVLLGTTNNDSVVGGRGDDVGFLRSGDDSFQWDPGDGNDTIEGQAGTDRLIFYGSDASENIDVSANGGRVRFFRNVANVTIDSDDVEQIDFNALGGVDNVVVGDVTGTDLKKTNVDLAAQLGGSSGDGQTDVVTVNGSQGNDTPKLSGDASGAHVTGLAGAVDVTHHEPADRLTVNLQGGEDTFDATGLAAGVVTLTINGGLGRDIILGSQGADLFVGGDGDDTALFGAGDDTFVWNPGDDNDTIEGQTGTDNLLFNGANIAETIDIVANGGRVRFTRDIANVTMDLDDVERIDFNALGGADLIRVQDVSGTDLKTAAIDLAAAGGAGDAQPDNVVVSGTNGADSALVDDDGTTVVTSGLAAAVRVARPEAANDKLTLNTLAGDDVVDARGLPAGLIQFVADGGAGDDVLFGSAGNDSLFGGADDDVLIGGPGTDVLDGGTGSNVLIQD